MEGGRGPGPPGAGAKGGGGGRPLVGTRARIQGQGEVGGGHQKP